MEHRKEYGSPRDMLDDALLQRVLEDLSKEDTRRCGCSGTPRSGCGCQNHTSPADKNPKPDRTGCGCIHDRNDRLAPNNARSGCGCKNSEHSANQLYSRGEAENNALCPLQPDPCISGRGVPPLQGFSLAMVYAPNQDWDGILEPEEALAKGTLFSGLLFPWYPSRCREGRDCGCGRD